MTASQQEATLSTLKQNFPDPLNIILIRVILTNMLTWLSLDGEITSDVYFLLDSFLRCLSFLVQRCKSIKINNNSDAEYDMKLI